MNPPPASVDGFESELALQEHIRAERIRFVLIQSALPIVFSPLAGAILAVALWHAVEAWRLLAFAAGLIVIAAQRVIMTRRFPDPPPTGRALRYWEWAYIASILLVDLWWGLGALYLIVPGALTESAIVFCFVMLMAGGHTARYSAHGPVVVLGVLALTLPITVTFALQRDTFHWALAFVALMFLAASFRSVRTLGYFFGRTYRLAHDLHHARRRAEVLASTDMLSGLLNRRAFYQLGERALACSLIDDARAMTVDFESHCIAFTLSLGVARHAPGENFDGFVARADAALYRAKREGRDRAIAA